LNFVCQSNSKCTCFFPLRVSIFVKDFMIWPALVYPFLQLIFRTIHDQIAYHSLDQPNICIRLSNLESVASTFCAHLKDGFHKIVLNVPDDFLYFEPIFEESFARWRHRYSRFLKYYSIFKFIEAGFLYWLNFFGFDLCHCFESL